MPHDCNFEIDIESIATNPSYQNFVKYEPEQFSGLVFKIPDSNITCIIQSSGNLTFTGATDQLKLEEAVSYIWPILKENKAQFSENDYSQYYQPWWQQYYQQYGQWQQCQNWWQPEQSYAAWQPYNNYGSFGWQWDPGYFCQDFGEYWRPHRHHCHHHGRNEQWEYPEW